MTIHKRNRQPDGQIDKFTDERTDKVTYEVVEDLRSYSQKIGNCLLPKVHFRGQPDGWTNWKIDKYIDGHSDIGSCRRSPILLKVLSKKLVNSISNKQYFQKSTSEVL